VERRVIRKMKKGRSKYVSEEDCGISKHKVSLEDG
jgi:hypothetical protein